MWYPQTSDNVFKVVTFFRDGFLSTFIQLYFSDSKHKYVIQERLIGLRENVVDTLSATVNLLSFVVATNSALVIVW